ncbi:MAG: hypothetical protein AABZ47_06220 [Planctomycetota bacterium]
MRNWASSSRFKTTAEHRPEVTSSMRDEPAGDGLRDGQVGGPVQRPEPSGPV